MTSGRAQTCSVPIRKMASLAGELFLLKAGIDAMSGRLELLLAEITDLQSGHEDGKEEFEIQPHAQHQAQTVEKPDELYCLETPDTALQLPATPALAACSQETHAAVSVADERVADAPLTPIGSTDAAELVADATTLTEPCPADDSETAILETPIMEPPLSSEAPVSEIDLPTADGEPSADKAEPACVVGTPPPPSGEPCNVIDLDERRTAATRKYRPTTLRAVGRWAAVAALIALVVVVAAAGTGFAGFGEITTSKAACSDHICNVTPGMPF